MMTHKINRRHFLLGSASIGINLPFIGRSKTSDLKMRNKSNRPLIVTSKTNPYVKAGEYKIILTAGTQTMEGTIKVEK